VQLFDFVNDRLFGLFYISESKNHAFVSEKQIKIRKLSVWVIPKHQEPAVSMKQLAKNPQLEKLFF
jgi:hypothetical protein